MMTCSRWGGVKQAGEFRIDEETGGEGVFTCGPYRKLEKGIYYITVYYQTDTPDNVSYAFSESAEYFYQGILSDRTILNEDRNKKTFTVWIRYDLEDFEVRTEYGGKGSLSLSGISVVKSKQTYVIELMRWFLFFLCLDIFIGIFYYLKKKWLTAEQLRIPCGLLLITIVASYPLFYDFLLYGTDLSFHLMRIEGLKGALQNGLFPVKMYPDWLNEYGYPVSVFYGDTLLYFPALLRLAGVPLQKAYQIYCVAVNAATCLMSYYVGWKILRDKRVAVFGSALYTFSNFRMMMMYSRPMVGLSAGMIFLPLVFYGAWRIFSEDSEGKEYRTAWIPLAVGLSGVIQAHVLTCVMIVLLFPVLLCILMKRVVRKKVFGMLCKAAFATIGINIWFLLPFLDGMQWNVNIADSARQDVMYNIQQNGIYPANLFSVFAQEPNYPYQTDYSVGMGLMAGAVLLLAFLIWKKDGLEKEMRRLGWLTLFLGGLTLFMATKVFPWDRLAQALGPLSILVRNLQFPWRFLALATVFLSVASCIAVFRLREDGQLMRQAILVIGLLSILSTGWMLGKHIKETPVLRSYDTQGIDGYDYVEGWGTQEYLIQGTDSSLLRYNEFVPGDTVIVTEHRKEGTKVELACVNDSENAGYVDIPLLYYKGYTAVCQETGIPIGIAENENHVMRILIPGNFQGTVKIRYAGLWYWKAAYVISLLFMVGTIGYALWHKAVLRREETQN